MTRCLKKGNLANGTETGYNGSSVVSPPTVLYINYYMFTSKLSWYIKFTHLSSCNDVSAPVGRGQHVTWPARPLLHPQSPVPGTLPTIRSSSVSTNLQVTEKGMWHFFSPLEKEYIYSFLEPESV